MTAAIENRLRLVHAALRDLARDAKPSDAATFKSATFLLTEVIAGMRLDGPTSDDPAAELAWLREMESFGVDLAAPSAAGVDDDGELDKEALGVFLRGAIEGEQADVTAADTVARGMSKKTIVVTLGNNKVLPARLAIRCDRSSNNYLDTTVLDEFGPLKALWDNGALIPRPYLLEPTGTVIGDPFIVSDFVEGQSIGNLVVLPTDRPALIADVARAIAGVHAVPVSAWPDTTAPRGNAYFDAEFDQVMARWHALGARSAILTAAFEWIARNRSLAYGPQCVTHNDFGFNNMLVDGDRVAAVLDWEFAHIGTPAADLGYFRFSAEAGSSFSAFLAEYAATGGTLPSDAQIAFYALWGQLRLAIMGLMTVEKLDTGEFGDVRYSLGLFSLRQFKFRIARMLEEFGCLTPEEPSDRRASKFERAE